VLLTLNVINMSHPLQAKAILENINLTKNNLTVQSQETLEKLAQIACDLQLSKTHPKLIPAIVHAFVTHSKNSSEMHRQVGVLNSAQSSLKKSLVLLKKLKTIKSSLAIPDAGDLETKLIPEKKKLEQSKLSKPQVQEELKHEYLLGLSEEATEVTRQVKQLQASAALINDLPSSSDKALQKLNEAKKQLEILEEEWNFKVNQILL